MENWDIYNQYREKVGRTHVRGEDLEMGDYHLVVHVWIMNDKGEFLIQQRTPWKVGWPGAWDCAAAGSSISGDDSEAAVLRETKEEIGLDLDMKKTQLLFSIKTDAVFDDVYLARTNAELEELTLQEEEVSDVRWATIEEIREMVKREEFIPYPSLEDVFRLTQSPISLMKATIDDSETLYSMQKEVFAPLYEKYQDHETSPVNQPKGRFLRRFEIGDYYKIHYNGELAGSVFVFKKEPGVMKLHIMNILQDYQNKGIAQETMMRLELIYPEVNRWELETIESEQRNCYLYEKMGYKRTGEMQVVNEKLSTVTYVKEEGIARINGM